MDLTIHGSRMICLGCVDSIECGRRVSFSCTMRGFNGAVVPVSLMWSGCREPYLCEPLERDACMLCKLVLSVLGSAGLSLRSEQC